MIPRLTLSLLAASLLVAPASAQPESRRETGTVLLTLVGGAGPAERPTGAVPGDLELELTCRRGRWDREAWGYAAWISRGHHAGKVTSLQREGAQTRLSLDLEVAEALGVPGGEASYRIAVQRQGNAYTGRYEGEFLGSEGEGKVTGRIRPLLVRSVPGVSPPAGGEHPRLICRKADLPTLRRRMETEQGEAILRMLTARSPLRYPQQVSDRRTSWMAANWGAIHLLTGDAKAADKARRTLMDQVVKRPMPMDRADIHHATRLLGLALAYDLCYGAWDAEFRTLITEYLRGSMNDLHAGIADGVRMSDLTPAPWRHRNAIRMAAVGCAAIALLGEKDADGREIAEATRLARCAERDVLLYLRWGLTASGGGLEGRFYKDFALANGVLQFLHADRAALGRDLSGANPWLISGYLLRSIPDADAPPDFGLSSISIQASGRWPMGLGAVPAEHLPAARWAFDRSVGLEGKGHFDCTYPYQAAYALANYPFDTPAAHPGDVLERFVADRLRGGYVFRNRWQDGDDILTTVNLRSMPLPGLGGKAAPQAGQLTITAFGKTWIDGLVGLKPANAVLGGTTIRYRAPRPQQAVLLADLTPLYLEDVTDRRPRRRRRKGDQPAPRVDPQLLGRPDIARFAYATGAFRDLGITCRRDFAVDYSGACGAPALFVLVDRLGGGADRRWDLGLGKARLRDGEFTIRADAGSPASLHGRIVAPAGAKRTALTGSDVYVAVFTIQRGSAPAVRVEGAGLEAKTHVGGQTITFADGGIRFAK